MKSFRAILKGYVQGVGFRYYAMRMAQRFGNIKGFIRNLPDGSVEVVAEGPDEALESFLDSIKQGPSAAIIEQVEVEWLPYTGQYRDFTVKY
jgi:acylphosphatase